MQRIYPVQVVSQLELYEPDIRDGIDSILESAREHGRDIRTQDEIWDELVEHVEIAPHGRFFVVIEDGQLMAWLAAKIYVDGKKRNGCITWAWARTGCHVSRDVIVQAEAYFRERDCQTAYLGRSFLQQSFTRLMRRYGYTMASVVYEKKLNGVAHVDTVGPASREIGEDVSQRDDVAAAENDGAPPGADAFGPAQPGDGRTTGAAAGHGDIDADAASGVELPADDAGPAASSVGLTGGAAVPAVGLRNGDAGRGSDGDGAGRSESGLDAGSGSGSGGAADAGAARASGT
jgi:hypothetical protein